MAQKLDRSYFGDSSRSTTNRTTERQKESASSSGGTVQKLDRSYFNKPKVAPTTGAVSPAKKTTAQSNSTSRQQWTATSGGRKSTTDAGKNKPSAQKKSFFEIATQNKAPGRVVGNAQPRQTSYAGQLGQVSRNAAAPNSRYDAWNLRTAQKQEIAAPSIGNARKLDEPTFMERVGKTITGGAKSSAAAYTNVRGYIQEGTHMARDVDVSGWNRDLNRYQYELRNADNDADRAYWQSEIDRVRRNIQNAGKATAESNASAQKNYRLADEIAANAEKDLTRAKQGAGAVGRLLVDAGASMTQSALDAIPNLITGGATGMVPFAARAFGGAAQQARKDGATWGQQGLYGAASAAKEVFTEKMFNIALPFAKAYGGGALDDVVERGIRSAVDKFAKTEVGKKALGSALTFGAGAVGEGLEEFIGDWMEWQLPRIYGGDVATAQETLSDSLYDFLVGATSGAMGGLVSPNTYRYDLGTAQATQQGAQERTDVQEGTRTASAQTNAQAQQEGAQRAIQEAVQRQELNTTAFTEEQIRQQQEAAVRKAADVLGQNGAKALTGYYSQTAGANPETTVRDFYRAYNAALNGTTAQDTNIPTALRMAAENAGQRDARVASQAKYFGENAQLVRDTSWKKANLPSKTSYALDSLAKTLGVEIRFADTVDEGRANAQYKDGVITLALDADDPVMTSVIHEATHRIKEISPESYEKLASFVQSNLSKEGTDFNMGVREQLYQTSDTNVLTEEMVADAFGRMVGDESTLAEFTMQNRSTVQKIVDTLTDIINAVKRALKGQNVQLSDRQRAAFRDLQGHVTEMRNLFNSALREAEQNKNTATEGGEAKYSLNEKFSQQFDDWLEKKTDNKGTGSFLVGTTSDALKSIGMSNYEIYWRKAKIAKIMNEHPAMTADVIKSVPNVLEHPILVMQSQTVANRITLFGETVDAEGKPVLAALELSPQSKRGEIQDFAVIASAYGKNNAQQLIDNSEILYVDPNKKRTTNWLGLLRLQLPSSLTSYGSIGRITLINRDVNGNLSFGAGSGKTAMQEAFEKAEEKTRYSLKDYSDAEQRVHRKKAIAYFGKTYNWNETGYLTPAGTKLDFSGRHEGGPGGYRTVDHRDIRDAIGEDYGGDDYSGSMVQFMSEGNIRISPESGGINLSVEPTKSQMDALSDFIGKNRGEVILDLDTPDGQTVSSTEYPRGTHSSKVLNDIKAYFKDGTKPHVSELARFRDSKKMKQFLEDYSREHGEMPTDTTPSAMKAFYERVYGREGWNGLGNADVGTVNSAFEAMQSNMEEGDAHKINRQAAERLPEEQGRAPSEVPKVNPDTGKNVTKTVSTILNSPLTSNDMARVYENAIADGTFDYEKIGDKDAIQQSQQKINRDGWETVAQQVLAKSSQTGFGQAFTKYDMADAVSAYNAAVTAGDHKMAYNLGMAISGAAHDSAQVVQAMNLMNRLTPEGKLLTLRRYVDQLNDKQAKKNSKKKNSTKKSQRAATQEQIDNTRLNYVENATGFRISEELAANYLMAEGDAERAAAWDAITTDIANQLPSTFREKANFWRYTMMLTNPTTHIRNTLGNAIQSGARKMKNGVGTAIERIAIRDKSQRTKAISLGQDGKALRAFALEQYQADEKAAMGAGKYSDSGLGAIERDIQEKRNVFSSKMQGEIAKKIADIVPEPIHKVADVAGNVVQKIGDLNSTALDAEDRIFNQNAYVDSFAQALKAKGVTAEEAASGRKHDLVEAARQYAINEAQKATYRNTTALSEAVSKLGRYEGDNLVIKAGSIAADAILPFRRTPANILTTGLDYSPVGLAKAITYDLYQVSKGEMSAADMVDHLSAGLTGSGILALGAYLATEGLLHAKAGDDDKEEKFNKATGIQEYSLEIGGKTYTLDWALPAAIPLFAGAAIMESVRSGGGTFPAVVDALYGISDVVLETSMLSSLNDFLSNISYADNIPVYIIDRILSSYGGQYVPTLGSKIASFADDTVRKSYVEKGTGQVASDADYFRQSVMKKVPGLRNKLQPSIDLWGNKISNGSVWERGIQSFISPGYLKTIDNDPVNQEIRRLAKATGEDSVYPTEAEKRLTTDDGDKNLTAEEYTEYAKLLGQTRYQALKGLLESSSYKNLSDEDKVSAIENVYKYAKKSAKAEILGQDGIGWEAKAQEAQKKYGIKPEVYAALYTQVSGIESVKDRNGETIPNSKGLLIMQAVYNMPGLSEKQRNALFEYLGVGKSIRHYNKALVNEKVRKNARLAGK